jgi:hypothetical protein
MIHIAKTTSSYGEYGNTPPAIYLLTLELKQSKAISSYFLPRTIASLAALATRIFTTVLAGILIASPVAGLRPRYELGFGGKSFLVPRGNKGPGFLDYLSGSSMSVARTFESVLWGNSDFFHEPKQRYEEFLELGDSLFPLMVDPEINS